MSEPDKSGDTSMDEILASIRRIISDEPGHERPDRRAVNPLIEPQRKPAGFMGLAPSRDARPLPPADRLSEALRASALNVSSVPAGPSLPVGLDADLEDLLEGPPEPLAPIEPTSVLVAADVRPAPAGADASQVLPTVTLEEEPRSLNAMVNGDVSSAVAAADDGADQSAKAIAAALAGAPIEAPLPTLDSAAAALLAPASTAADRHAPSAVRAQSLNSFPSLPSDGERTLSYTAIAAASQASPKPAGMVAVPLTPAEATHAATALSGGTAPAKPSPVTASPRPGFPFAPQNAEPQPAASSQPLPALDRDTQAAAAMALGALAAGLAASPATAAPAESEAPQAAAPVRIDAAPVKSQPVPPSSTPVAAPAQAAPPVRTLEDIVTDMVRPMLEKWIADNMPRIMEKALRGEIKGKKL